MIEINSSTAGRVIWVTARGHGMSITAQLDKAEAFKLFDDLRTALEVFQEPRMSVEEAIGYCLANAVEY